MILDGAYRPATLRVRVGTRVTWVNRGDLPQTAETADVGFFELDRTKLAAEGKFDLHVLEPGEAESVRFDRPGRYDYYSSLDPSMRGTVIVRP